MPIQLERMTLAATNVDAVVNFYNIVLEAGFEGLPDSPLYIGMLGGIEAMICPNTIAQVDANQSRIQLRLRVEDVESVLEAAKANGSSFLNDMATENARIVSVRDPDSNSIELIQWFG